MYWLYKRSAVTILTLPVDASPIICPACWVKLEPRPAPIPRPTLYIHTYIYTHPRAGSLVQQRNRDFVQGCVSLPGCIDWPSVDTLQSRFQTSGMKVFRGSLLNPSERYVAGKPPRCARCIAAILPAEFINSQFNGSQVLYTKGVLTFQPRAELSELGPLRRAGPIYCISLYLLRWFCGNV